MIHTVVQVKPTRDFKVNVYFDDGRIKLYDVPPLLDCGVFKQISSINAFMEKCTIMGNTLAWDIGGNFDEANCLDIDPETIYTEGVEVADPLSGQVT
jgi:hypothetical protein